MLATILNHLNNYFVVKNGVHRGTFAIVDGTVSLDFLKSGQYFKIVGSVFNDGVYQYPVSNLVDEEFEGEIWVMAIPKELLDLVEEISEWLKKYPITGYISEKFGNYSYSQRTNFRSNAAISWQDVFSVRLNRWRKV
jgi:hypothetical protein